MCKSENDYTVPQLPLNSTLVLLGDSITAMATLEYSGQLHPPAIGRYYRNVGYANTANLLSGSRYFIPLDGNQGINGDTVAGVLARINTVVALKPAVVLLLVGINSILHSVPEESIMKDYRLVCDRLIAAGSIVIASTIFPNYSVELPLNPSQEQSRKHINSFILSQSDIQSIDVEGEINDPSYFVDGLHLNPLGAFMVASKVAPLLGSLIANGKVQDTIQGSGNYVINPQLSGVRGTLLNALGTVADNWTLAGADAGGAIVTGNKSASDDRQLIEISGKYIGKKVMAQLRHTGRTSLIAGDVVEGFLDIEIVNPFSNILNIDLMMTGYNADYSEAVMTVGAFHNDLESPLHLPVGRYIMRTPPQQLIYPVTKLIVGIDISFVATELLSGISGLFKVYNCSVRKIKE